MANSFADTTEHGLGKPVEAYECWAVYKDYDGEAPDSADQVLCATVELAKQVAAILERLDAQHNEEDEEDEPETPDQEFQAAYPFCYTDGWEHCASYEANPAIGTKDRIATSLAHARRLLLGG